MNRIKTMGASVGQAWRRFNTQKVAKAAAHPSHCQAKGSSTTNITPKMRRTMLSQVASRSREEPGHFKDIFKAGRFISADGSQDYPRSRDARCTCFQSPVRTTALRRQNQLRRGPLTQEAAMRRSG